MERKEVQEMTGIRIRALREEPRELTSAQKAMRVGGVLYLPHYTKPGAFVGPGQPPPEFKWNELEAQGAVPERVFLWSRGHKA